MINGLLSLLWFGSTFLRERPSTRAPERPASGRWRQSIFFGQLTDIGRVSLLYYDGTVLHDQPAAKGPREACKRVSASKNLSLASSLISDISVIL